MKLDLKKCLKKLSGISAKKQKWNYGNKTGKNMLISQSVIGNRNWMIILRKVQYDDFAQKNVLEVGCGPKGMIH